VAGRVEVTIADIRTLPFAEASFYDVVPIWAVHDLEDGQGRSRALAEMVRVLRPGGRLLLHDIANRAEYLAILGRLGLDELRLVVPSPLWDRVVDAVSFASFRPATVAGRAAEAA
jgi:ubiquinone/menaquinone biosynthesis C-methylase UbiE